MAAARREIQEQAAEAEIYSSSPSNIYLLRSYSGRLEQRNGTRMRDNKLNSMSNRHIEFFKGVSIEPGDAENGQDEPDKLSERIVALDLKNGRYSSPCV